MFFASSLFVLLLAKSLAIDFPQYMPKCKWSDLKTCGLEAANKAFPYLLKGDPSLNIRNLLPYSLGDISIDEANLRLKLRNCELYGLESTHLYRIEYPEPHAILGLLFDKVSIIGEYEAGGSIYDAKLPRAGIANFTLSRVNAVFKIVFVVKKDKEDSKRISPYKVDVDIDEDTSTLSLSENGSGIPYLFVQDSKTVFKHILPLFENALTSAYLELSNGVTRAFKRSEIFLPE